MNYNLTNYPKSTFVKKRGTNTLPTNLNISILLISCRRCTCTIRGTYVQDIHKITQYGANWKTSVQPKCNQILFIYYSDHGILIYAGKKFQFSPITAVCHYTRGWLRQLAKRITETTISATNFILAGGYMWFNNVSVPKKYFFIACSTVAATV